MLECERFNKAVLQSINPYYCMLIANREKTIEVRKTKPKLKPPFTVYIYCTKSAPYLVLGDVFRGDWSTEYTLTRGWSREKADELWGVMNGKVIGKYICDTFVMDHTFGHDPMYRSAACLSIEEAAAYCTSRTYGWNISNLEIFEDGCLKELKEFGIDKAPQSWCYVEEREDF